MKIYENKRQQNKNNFKQTEGNFCINDTEREHIIIFIGKCFFIN